MQEKDNQQNEIQKDANKSWKVKKAQAAQDLIQKYCALNYKRTIKRFRIYASLRGVSRPWDGDDGVDFNAWLKKLGSKYAPGTMAVDNLNEMMEKDEAEYQKQKMEEEEAAQQAGEEREEFDWEGTDDMSKYEFSLYHRYKDSKDILGGLINAIGDGANLLKSMSEKFFGSKKNTDDANANAGGKENDGDGAGDGAKATNDDNDEDSD